jgi:hypothetical protein
MLHHYFVRKFLCRKILILLSLLLFAASLQAQTKNLTVPSPKSVLGFEPAEDRKIADWDQIVDYFAKLDAGSNRVLVKIIGATTLKKPFVVAFISSEENIRNLDKYRQISAQLADPRNVKDDKTRETLMSNGKTIVAVSCSIHSTEIVASQMSMQFAYEMATRQDAETKEILDNTILLLMPSTNPDGIDIVAEWYRKTLGTPYEGISPPVLYHYYAGHDDNRDWFMLNLAETQIVTKLFWQEWFPQIVYDVHQMGQNGARFIIPPFHDPPNPNIHPLILRELGAIGYKMAADLQAANFKGVATNAVFDTWWHGGFRSAPYYHNSIGILSEAASANLMSPVQISQEQLKRTNNQRGLSSPLETATNHPSAWTGGTWSPRDIAGMEMVAIRSVLQMAAKFRLNYLRNFYELNRAAADEKTNPNQPVAYIVPAAQGSEEAVSRFIEILLAQGVEVYLMKNELHLALSGSNKHTEYPLGSYLIFTAQPQRANVQALFEKQVYPNRINANGEAEVPYDVAGWTLPLQMGIEYYAVTQIADPKEKRQLKQIANINEVRQQLNLAPNKESFARVKNPLSKPARIALYKGFTSSMDEGWTRYVFDLFQISYTSLPDADIRKGDLRSRFDVIVLPAQSENEIVNGLRKGAYPDELTGGITETGVENLRKFVESGGKLVCFDDSCEMVIKRFNLPLKNVLNGLKRSEFYCPGSILNLEVDKTQPLAKGFTSTVPAYFINSAAFEATDESKVKVVARYAAKNALLSGWLLGEKYLNSKIALAETELGQGKIVLFGFRPQHRGQTWATYPFVFNALTN